MTAEKIKCFNEIVSSLLIQLSPIIGSTYHMRFNMIIKANCLKPIQQFIKTGIPVREKILNKDETYFEEKDRLDEIKNVNEMNMNEILQLRNIYINLDSVSKSNVWDFMTALLIIAEEYLELKK